MNAGNDPQEFSGNLESEDKAFIIDLVTRECFLERDSLEKNQYQCAHQCVICSRKDAQGLEASASIAGMKDLADGGNDFTFPFEKRQILISQVVHEFFENKWKAKQLENKMLSMVDVKGSQLENPKSTSTADVATNEERVSLLPNEIKLEEPLQTLQIIPEVVEMPEYNCGPTDNQTPLPAVYGKVKAINHPKLCNKANIKPKHVDKNIQEDSVCEKRKVIMYESEERANNTNLKRPRDETETVDLYEKNIEKDMRNKYYVSNKKLKLLKKYSLENIEKLVHLNQKYNSHFAAKSFVKTAKELDILKDILEKRLKRTNDREKDMHSEFVKGTNTRCTANLQKPDPTYYSRGRRYTAEHRKPKTANYTRGNRSPNNKYPSDQRHSKPTYQIKFEISQNSSIEKKFHSRPNDRFKQEYKSKYCCKRKVERVPDKAESVTCLPVNDTISEPLALDRQKGKLFINVFFIVTVIINVMILKVM